MWEKKPVLLLVLALAAILVGTIVTMVLPFKWVNTEADRIATVTPYNALQLAGRDVYIREGCNNCHTQTVRPLVADVLRYGDYSKSGEFVYDRPHLWGSRRTGPDLARVGGKYPDQWHYEHMKVPSSIVPRTNMPAYAFLEKNQIDPAYTKKKMEVLAFPYTDDEIKALTGKTELDAMVAYLQKLGSDIPWRAATQTEIVGELKNPFLDDPTILPEGKKLYAQHCAACHGEDLKGGIGSDISDVDLVEADLFELIYNGIPDGGMPGFASLGSKRVWMMVNYVKSQKTH